MSKLSLFNSDVVVTYRGATHERQENLYAILKHYDLTYQDYRIILIEADVEPKFDWNVLSDSKVLHVFVHDAGPFPKATLCNMGVKLSTSTIVIFNDIDCLAQPETVQVCVNELLNNPAHNVICPYTPVVNVSGKMKQIFLDTPSYPLIHEVYEAQNETNTDFYILYSNNIGGVVVLRRQDFIQVGGWNPRFLGWGGEDNEFFVRATRLGLSWCSVPPPLFHLHHDSLNREGWSGQISASGKSNEDLTVLTQTMPIEELRQLAAELKVFFN